MAVFDHFAASAPVKVIVFMPLLAIQSFCFLYLALNFAPEGSASAS